MMIAADMRTDADEPLIVNVRKGAKDLGMAPKTFRRHIKEGNLKAVWLGAMLGVHVSEIRRAAEQGLPRLTPLPAYKKLVKARAMAKAVKAPARAVPVAVKAPARPVPLPPAKGRRKAERERRPSP
jgi:hypothetical protein